MKKHFVIVTWGSSGDVLPFIEMGKYLLSTHQKVSFVTNPYFKNPRVVDNELLSQAGRDLETIIELSRSIRKSADNLSRGLENGP